MTWLYLNLKLNRLISAEYQHKSKSVSAMKGYPLFIHLDHKYALYSVLLAWTVFLFHTHIATYSLYTRSLKYVFYMLITKLLSSQSIFMHLEYKNIYTYFLAFTATLPENTSLHLPISQPLPHFSTTTILMNLPPENRELFLINELRRSKASFLYSGNELEIFKYPPFE